MVKQLASKSNASGFALLLVLITLMLATAMAVLFLSSVGRERRGVDVYSKGSQARHLAGMTVNRVMGYIGAATQEGDAGDPVSWASQPGMIRTYGSDGNGRNVYKLYSWNDTIQQAAAYTPNDASQVPAGSWQADTAFYTDLNQPIADVYPIMDPEAEGDVEGFSIDESAPAITGASGVEAPMPVKWLYVLEDGQMVAPTGTGTSATVTGAGAANPIVGRVAYWTDDETSKVNINTASEGAYWDWPKSASLDDMQFAGNPPVKNEFQRIPGHPAMTSLSAVFPSFLTNSRWSGNSPSSAYRQQLQDIYSFTPRTGWGGSQGGTFPIQLYNLPYAPAKGQGNAPPLPLKTERLFVNSDDLLFEPSRNSYSMFSPDALAARQFFLTAASRGPETTLFETPRVSLWPITWPHDSSYFRGRAATPPTEKDPDTTEIEDNPWMTPEDKLLAFCATLNKGATIENRYYVQRLNPDSPTYDWTEVDRNRQLFGDYLRRLTDLPVPGFGSSLSAEAGGANRDSILTKAFDFVRSQINQYSTAATPSFSYTGVSFNVGSSDYIEPQAFSVVPIRTDIGDGHRGLGAFPELREAALVFFATQRNPPAYTGSSDAEKNDPRKWTNLIDVAAGQSQTTQMRALLTFDFLNGAGLDMRQTPTFWIKVTQGGFSVNGTSVEFGGKAVQWSRYTGRNASTPTFAGLYKSKTGAGSDYKKDMEPKSFDPSGSGADNWSLISDGIAVSGPTFTFNALQPLIVEIYGVGSDPRANPTGDPKLKVATYEIDFSPWESIAPWNGAFPTPLAPAFTAWDYPNDPAATPSIPDPAFDDKQGGDYRRFGTEIAPSIHDDYTLTDTARTRRLSPNDFRLPSYEYPFSLDMRNRLLASDSVLAKPLAKWSGINWKSYMTAFGLVTPYDTVISMVADPSAAGGDPRVVEAQTFVPVKQAFSGGEPPDVVLRGLQSTPIRTAALVKFPGAPRNNKQYHSLGSQTPVAFSTGYNATTSMVSTKMATAAVGMKGSVSPGNLGNRQDWSSSAQPIAHLTGLAGSATIGDWTSTPGGGQDGGLLLRPDQEYPGFYDDPNEPEITQTPFFSSENASEASQPNFYSPNRQVPSPVILGSLPRSTSTGWQTLAFSPNTANPAHPGTAANADKAPDHLWLDLFWMPVAEPYPISDQLSTAGKVNLNYQIAPFSYITRKTGLHAVMKSTWITALPTAAAADYKSPFYMRSNFASTQTRYPIDVEKTLELFDSEVFGNGEIFRSASQLCEMLLVPEGENVSTFWNNKQLTSDTAREEPYNHLYPRVTTKSNTFTVHWRVQVLQKRPGAAQNVWEEDKDTVASELRGSTLIERYIDPNATDIPDYATTPNATPLSEYYKWRTVSENYFQPRG